MTKLIFSSFIIVFAICFFNTGATFAQGEMEEVVYFEDGTVVRGKILELNTTRVIIETKDTQKINRSFKKIHTISKEKVEAEVPFVNKTKPIVPKHSFGIGLETSYFDYEEDGLMEEDGFMYGVVGSYIYHSDNKLMINTSLKYSFGELDYDGQTWDGTPITEDTDDWIVECRGLVGYDYVLNGKHLITPFIGIAYRYWNDDIDGIGGYEREIEYLYSPIGFKTVSPLSDKWTWGLSAEYDLFWGGKVKSHLSDVDPGFNDPEVDQDFWDGYGLRFSVQFKRELTKNYALSIEPYIRYWDIDKSDTETLSSYGTPLGYVYEPENETMSYGLRLNFEF